MKQKTIQKVFKISWKETLKKIEKGETASFNAAVEDGNRVRIAAWWLNRKFGTNYSVSISGNTITVKYE